MLHDGIQVVFEEKLDTQSNIYEWIELLKVKRGLCDKVVSLRLGHMTDREGLSPLTFPHEVRDVCFHSL